MVAGPTLSTVRIVLREGALSGECIDPRFPPPHAPQGGPRHVAATFVLVQRHSQTYEGKS